MARQWRERPPADDSALPQDLDPVVRRVYARRGVTNADAVDLSLARLVRPDSLSGLDAAAAILAQAVTDGARIAIAGDFDADGATASAVMVLGLRSLGAQWVQPYVPDRFRFGYGLSPALVEQIAQAAPQVLVTVDNGISSHAGVEAAHAAGMQVVITDHHLSPTVLPDADAIVNPNQAGDAFPSKALCGVGVAFYVLSAVRARLQSQGRAADDLPRLADLLDLVALGTVADVVTLDHNNRILVENGLRRIRAGRARPGLLALLDLAGRDFARCTAQDLAFGVAPRLNAAGRLDDMAVGIRCLLADDPAQARALAAELDTLNRNRRVIQDDMHRAALEQLPEVTAGDDAIGVVVSADDWHEGVVGLVASKVKEAVHRPVVAFAPAAGESGVLKGSARSIPGFHVRDALAAIDAGHPGLITKFGGHAMAAGLSLSAEALEPFRQAFDAIARQWLSDDALADVGWLDGVLQADELNLDTAEALQRAGPWGQGFEPPCFEGRFRIIEQRVVGDKHVRARVRTLDGDQELVAIAFNREPLVDVTTPARLIYRLEPNEFRGYVTPQLVVEDWMPAA